MKLPRILLAAFSLASIAIGADSGFKSLFNGKDLSGWAGLPGFWSVRDGALTGQTTADQTLTANTFLVWQGGDVKDFELRLKFRLTPNNEREAANSGVQYRSRIIDPATFAVGGYQADIDMGRYIGMLYEEKGRGILMQPGQKIRVGPPGAATANAAAEPKGKGKAKGPRPTIETLATVTTPEQLASAYKKGDWNEIVIIAKGNHLQHFINGTLTADVTDADNERGAKSGVLALQLHTGPPMTVQFKDIQLKQLR